MKLHKIFSRFLPIVLLSLTISSCQEDIVNIDELLEQSQTNKKSEDDPQILAVYDYTTYMASGTTSTPCDEAEMGQRLVISGENLEGVTALSFLGHDIDKTDYYAQWDMIIMSVPYKLPEKDAANNISCTTKFGVVEYPIGISIPNITISGVTNEFQMPGTQVDINGAYLSLCEFETNTSKIYIENTGSAYKTQVEIVQVTDEVVTVVIPDDAPDNSYFTFEVAGETLEQKIHYRPTDLLLVPDTDSEAIVAAGANYGTFINGEIESDMVNIFGDAAKYFRFKGSIPAGTMLSVFYVTDAFELEEGKDASDYEFVYEINTKAGCAIPVGTTYKLMVNNVGINMWGDYSKVTIDTNGEWVTQRIDYTTVKANLTAAGDYHKFNIKAVGALSNADHTFANFRIEPIIK
ncbi:MAG: hypothetical protein R3Y26_06295 [Rikenellaceae bacterium]